MFCPSCGNEPRPNARFCDTCGQSLASDAPVAAIAGANDCATDTKFEYKRVFLDWTQDVVKWDQEKAAPHPLSPTRAAATVSDRVLGELGPMFQAGWALDGSYADAVTSEVVSKRRVLSYSPHGWYSGAHVKLRRVMR